MVNLMGATHGAEAGGPGGRQGTDQPTAPGQGGGARPPAEHGPVDNVVPRGAPLLVVGPAHAQQPQVLSPLLQHTGTFSFDTTPFADTPQLRAHPELFLVESLLFFFQMLSKHPHALRYDPASGNNWSV